MRRIGLAAAVLTVSALSAESSAACATVPDPSGDIEAATGVVVPDRHLDLRSVSIRPTAAAVVVTFKATALSDARKGSWRLTFVSRGATLYVSAGLGAWVNVGEVGTPSGFRAGIAGRAGREVTGAIDYTASSILVTVPYAAFGGRLTRRDTNITNVTASAEEVLLNAGAGAMKQQASLRDSARAPRLSLTRC